MKGETPDDETAKIFFDLRAGAPSPLARRDPDGGWGNLADTTEDDADGYVSIKIKPGGVVIPDGTHGRLTLRLSAPGAYDVTLGSGEYHLVFELECDGCEIGLAFGPSGPRLAGASVGPLGVSPIFNDAKLSGLTHLEFSGLAVRPGEMRHVTLRPGLTLLARGASLWLTRTGLTLEELPTWAAAFTTNRPQRS